MTTTPELTDVKEAVRVAATGIVEAFGHGRARFVPDGQGGAWVEIAAVHLGDSYTAPTTFVICLLPFNLPGADIYPLFLRRDLVREDGRELGDGFTFTELRWPGDGGPRPVTQVSRRTRRNDFSRQTPVQKIEKVIAWVRSQ